ncbi:MAG: molybdate ABC transporter substrate-binding protein [Armatimonadetes bacterium]|nr:molybdate ABC transporter substrate-binding protein [Armatimonadota bacterium]
MSRASQLVIIVLLVAVVGIGALLVARGGRGGEASPTPTSSELLVYAPCGMSSPLAVATQRFREQSGLDVPVVFDNAIVLVRRIRAGERPDVFISPGEVEMKALVGEGFIDPETVQDFGTLDLVVIAPKKTEGLDAISDLTSPSVETISLADPELNSVGYYGMKALQSAGLWESLKGKIFPREYPLEAVTMATQGQVDAGITYLTCPLDTAPEKADASEVRIVETFPRDSYPPIRLQVGIMKDSAKRESAQAYIDFLRSPPGQEAVATSGVLPVEVIE